MACAKYTQALSGMMFCEISGRFMICQRGTPTRDGGRQPIIWPNLPKTAWKWRKWDQSRVEGWGEGDVHVQNFTRSATGGISLSLFLYYSNFFCAKDQYFRVFFVWLQWLTWVEKRKNDAPQWWQTLHLNSKENLRRLDRGREPFLYIQINHRRKVRSINSLPRKVITNCLVKYCSLYFDKEALFFICLVWVNLLADRVHVMNEIHPHARAADSCCSPRIEKKSFNIRKETNNILITATKINA